MGKNKLSLISFIVGVLLIFLAMLVVIFFPSLKITAAVKNIVLLILLFPWAIFILSILFGSKKDKN
ncbi:MULTISPECIES: hypothetical protein [unclassified Francisella]|uniref:hypothetical protein n=1 Tax=unclassified Francisella TaxID=2610885 RepID=UPI002E307B18|nr:MULTISPECIES: hypothetical protein [unclassified Francisella]MED7819042.1 hypothetical protein [Francisella sp. 19S2-4]MED7829879.1 hypothetical protein [Francisella sp. 19S2-10]